jgi:hypothetical protein
LGLLDAVRLRPRRFCESDGDRKGAMRGIVAIFASKRGARWKGKEIRGGFLMAERGRTMVNCMEDVDSEEPSLKLGALERVQAWSALRFL